MIQPPSPHQYICRQSNQVITESLIGDRAVSFVYNRVREYAPAMFKALTSSRMSSLLSFYHYDFLDKQRPKNNSMFQKFNIDWRECVEPPGYYNTPRKVFERQIRYWELRSMENSPEAIVSCADSRLLIGSFSEVSNLFIKEKLFSAEELLGAEKYWPQHFTAGDFAVFRLTPDKYHYNHMPVSGRVAEIYEVDGCHHSCNPSAQIAVTSLYAKNRRIVTIIDTDVKGGSNIGYVAMVEIVALMIGDIVQSYSDSRYEKPRPIQPGMYVRKGCPKSLYRPGSSTDVLIFEPGRIDFCTDLVRNSQRSDVQSRYTNSFGRPLIETDIQVRSTIGYRARKPLL